MQRAEFKRGGAKKKPTSNFWLSIKFSVLASQQQQRTTLHTAERKKTKATF